MHLQCKVYFIVFDGKNVGTVRSNTEAAPNSQQAAPKTKVAAPKPSHNHTRQRSTLSLSISFARYLSVELLAVVSFLLIGNGIVVVVVQHVDGMCDNHHKK
mmetsp:Transcript_7837/g.18111  ORF Transcript_7837/g.18111 Transcript_7837/m.18111 type:complete len:101 (+) Transcript_7837:753-1055(+)